MRTSFYHSYYKRIEVKLQQPQWRIQELTLGGCICQRGGGRGRKSLKVLKVEVKVIFEAGFGRISIKIMLKIKRNQI